jgi:hypothetical protein
MRTAPRLHAGGRTVRIDLQARDRLTVAISCQSVGSLIFGRRLSRSPPSRSARLRCVSSALVSTPNPFVWQAEPLPRRDSRPQCAFSNFRQIHRARGMRPAPARVYEFSPVDRKRVLTDDELTGT